MASPIPSYTLEYHKLREAAETFGFHREADLIATRQESLGHPFTLFVVGEQGAGKSSLINLLLGRPIAPIGRSLPWLNIYRRPEGGQEMAEIILQDDAVPTVLSLSEARALTDEIGDDGAIAGGSIDRIVWHINAPGLPLDIAFAEAPATDDADLPDRYFWQADGLLWLMRADQLMENKTRMLVTALQQKKVLPVISMGVLTHMDAVPNNKWLQIVQDARSGFTGALDLVVPFTASPQRVDSIFDDPNALMYRELRNRFFQGARLARQKNQSYFVEAMGDALSGRFEAFVDRVLANRWAYLSFQRALDEQIETLELGIGERIQQYAETLKTYSMEQATALEKASYAPPELVVANEPPPSLERLRNEIHLDIVESSQRIFGQLQYDSRPVTQWQPGEDGPIPRKEGWTLKEPPAAAFKLPEMPSGHLAFLRGQHPGTRVAAEAAIYAPGSEGDGMPHPAELWQSATVWLPRIAELAEEELAVWKADVFNQIRRSLLDSAALSFKALHGFLPGEAAAVLMPLEQTYERLTGESVKVPTPHLPGAGLSPALFLCRMQEDAFIERWNSELTQKCYEAIMPRLHKQILHDVERLRNQLVEQWEKSQDSVHRRVDVAWRQYGRGLTLKNAVKWSVPWISSLIRDRLPDPSDTLARRRVSLHPPYDVPVALFLDGDGTSFLEPIYKPVDPPLNPDQFIAQRLQETIRQICRQNWRVKAPITVSMELRKMLRRRTSIAIGTLAGFSLIWIMLFGTSTVSLTSLSVIAAPYIFTVGYAIKRMIDHTFDTGNDEQAERVYTLIHRHIQSRMDIIRDEIDDLFLKEAFRDTIYEELKKLSADPGGPYMPYAELVRRLRKIGEVRV
ncbi:MAG: hypothetical protein R2834_06315 [Rhodothermales bacterium]